jgi:hypothetical protein
MKTRIRLGLLLGFLLTSILWIPSDGFGEEIFVIANRAFPTTSINSLDLMEIYTGHYVVYQRFKIQPLDQPDEVKIKRLFLAKVMNFTLEGYKVHWQKWTFKTGRQPPMVVQDSKELIRAVQKEAGGMGYVWDRDAQGVEGIKVLLKIPVNE